MGEIALVKKITAILAIILLLIFSVIFIKNFFIPTKETFRCDHCHRYVEEQPIHIGEQTVDLTICSDCYQDYANGGWTICYG